MAARLIFAFMDERTGIAKKSPAGRRGGTRMTGGWGGIRPRSMVASAWWWRAGLVKDGFTPPWSMGDRLRIRATVGKRTRSRYGAGWVFPSLPELP